MHISMFNPEVEQPIVLHIERPTPAAPRHLCNVQTQRNRGVRCVWWLAGMIRPFPFRQSLKHERFFSLPNLVHQPLEPLSSYRIFEVKLLRQLWQTILGSRFELSQIIVALLAAKMGLFALRSTCAPHATRPTSNRWCTAVFAFVLATRVKVLFALGRFFRGLEQVPQILTALRQLNTTLAIVDKTLHDASG